jgi:hypothetical protein
VNIDTLPVHLSYSGGPNGPGRRRRASQIRLVVIHTNEPGPDELTTGAEGLAAYTAAAHPTDYPAYHVVGDNDSAVRTAGDGERVNGAGGVAEFALHYCLYGTARQTAQQWADPYSHAELVLAATIVRQWCDRYSLALDRITGGQLNSGRGICGHGDVAAVFPNNAGHYDPGPAFPWGDFLTLVRSGAPSAADLEAYFRLLEEADVEHGMCVDAAIGPDGEILKLDRWGGLHLTPGKAPVSTLYRVGEDVARKVLVKSWAKGQPSGYVVDLAGGLHAFGGAPAVQTVGYFPKAKIVQINEV